MLEHVFLCLMKTENHGAWNEKFFSASCSCGELSRVHYGNPDVAQMWFEKHVGNVSDDYLLKKQRENERLDRVAKEILKRFVR